MYSECAREKNVESREKYVEKGHIGKIYETRIEHIKR